MDKRKIADLLYPNITQTPEDIFKKYPPRSLKEGEVVSRFAPSPTGFMHIGGFFQVLIDRSLAKNSGGVFYLRNEDTDKKRQVDGAMDIVFEILDRFDQQPDEYQKVGQSSVGAYGPYIQSLRTDIYQTFAKDLVARGKAFPCFCKKTEGKEEILKARELKFSENDSNAEFDPCRDLSFEEVKKHIDNGDNFAIRLKTPNDGTHKMKFTDIVKGEVELPENAKDVILIKNDGIPPYAFAHAIDDTLMGTSIVVRGEEWFTSTPAHIDIFNALGFKPLKYYHTPNICKIDEKGGKRKLSKRKDPESNMQYFFEEGYPTTSVIEYLLNLISSAFEPWRAKNPDAHYSDFKFGIKDITAISPLFDFDKLNDIAKNIIAKMSAEEVYDNWLKWAEEFKPSLAEYLKANKEYATKVLSIDRGGAKPRKDIYKYSMIEDYFSYMFHAPKEREELDTRDNYNEFLFEYSKNFTLPTEKDVWFAGVKEVAEKLGYATDNKLYKASPDAYKGNTAKACEYIRLALTGKKNSPDIFEIMTIFGQEETLRRLRG